MITAVNGALAQQIVDTVKDVCGHDINFIHADGTIFASTNPSRIGAFHEAGRRAAEAGMVIEVCGDESFAGTQQGINMPVYHGGRLMAVIGITGNPDEVRQYAYLAERITSLLIREQEISAVSRSQADQKHYVVTALAKGGQEDRAYLIECLKEYGADFDSKKRFLILRIRPGFKLTNLSLVQQRIGQLFDQAGVMLSTFCYPRGFWAVLEEKEWRRSRPLIQDWIRKNSGLIQAAAGKLEDLFGLKGSYESAVMAMKSLEESEGGFAVFDDLDLELILSSVNGANQEAFLQKVLSGLSREDMEVMEAYFSEDMSLANTCKRLYIHKNTLQYKLNHIWQKSGLNPRSFQDGVLLYLALRLRSFYGGKKE